MQVRVVRSFADRRHGSYSQGDTVDLPDGVDWLDAGFVEPVGDDAEAPGVEQYHTGSGWYDVPGVEKKLRKDDAIEALRNG